MSAPPVPPAYPFSQRLLPLAFRITLVLGLSGWAAPHSPGAPAPKTAPAATPRPAPFSRILPGLASLAPAAVQGAGRIEFAGARSFSPEQLRTALAEQIREITERGLTRPRADDTAYYLSLYYRKQGYPDVEVNYEIRGATLVLRINEGPRTYLRQITFSGNRSISEATLFEYMLGATRERLAGEPTAFPFVLADVQTGAARVRGLYESEGFLNAVVEDPKVTISADRTRAEVQVNIVEGQRFTFGEFTFGGTPIFSRQELLQGLGLKPTDPYTTQQVTTLQRNLQFFFKSRGYFLAKVDVESDPAQAVNGRVPVNFTITPGAQYRFDGVTVTGLDRLRKDFLPRRFAPLKGQVYDPAKFDEKYRELLRTGLFRTLRINSVPQADNTIRLDITAEEAKAREIGFSIGASSYEGLEVGLRLADRNIFGNGRPLSFSVDSSQRGLRGELLYVDPWIFESNFSLRTRLYAQSREEIGYSKRETGFRADLSRKLGKNFELSTFLQLENVEITESRIEPQYLGSSSYQIGTLGLSQTLDFRDNVINPSRGIILTNTLDINVLANEVAFGRGTLRFSYYHPLTQKISLALGARTGLIYPVSEVPIDERYFNGGSTTVRSFRERRLGPHDRFGNPIGGQAFTVFNAEITFPLVKALQGALFVDAGNVISKFEDAGFSDMRFALGVGLRYKLPIGPLRVDLAVNPNPKDNESIGAFHFTFGFAF